MRAGTIGLVHSKGFFGRVIRLAQEGRWNHIVVAKGDGTVYSAEPKTGVRLRPESYFKDLAWLTNEPLTTRQGNARVAFCESMLGTPYNWWAILAFSRWWLPLPKAFVAWTAKRNAVICSELGVMAIRADGTKFLGDRLASTVSPAGVDVEFRKLGW